MTDNTIQTTIEILGKSYPIRCPETELESLQQAAKFLNAKMSEIQDSGKAINIERIAIMAALNITHQLLQQDKQKDTLMSKINTKISSLQDKLETAINKQLQAELIYSSE
jgi:cell division protein ZapA